MPTSITSTPTDIRPAVAARVNIAPLVRASRPRTTSGLPLDLAQAPRAAAWRATSSGVRSLPTIPRIPETLIMRVSDMPAKLAGTVPYGRTGNGKRGNGERERGNGKRGNGERGTGNGKRGTGNGERDPRERRKRE